MILFRVFVLSLLVCLAFSKGKSDRKVVVEESEEVNDIPTPTNDDPVNFKSEYPVGKVTKESILKDHDKVAEGGDRKFNGAALAYVTPWNNKGYDLAKQTSDKLTHVSPVWLQMKPQTADMARSCRITGAHDIDRDWIEALRSKNNELRVVPRVLFEEWSMKDLQMMLESDTWSLRCLNDLVKFLKKNGFDGAVVEIWMNTMVATRGEAAPIMLEMLSSWGDQFHKKGLELIVPVGPPVTADYKLTGMFTSEMLWELADHVDYVQIMTYDYPANKPTGVAPLEWVQQSIEALLNDSKDLASKLMIGINHYGYEHSPSKHEAVKFDRYLEVLAKKDSILRWDSAVKEHMIKQGDSVIYYPSLTSVELRMKVAQVYGVGIGIWDYGQGLNYFSRLL